MFVVNLSRGSDDARSTEFLDLLWCVPKLTEDSLGVTDQTSSGPAYLSFPRSGISIALDIAVRDDTQSLIDALNEHVLREGGRIYLAKDQFTRPEHFRAMETRLPSFQAVRAKWDPEKRFKSAQSVRLFGD